MRRFIALVLATAAMLAASIAAADSPVPFALAVNTPTSWGDRDAFAASGYMGITKELGVRANVAAYDYTSNEAAFWLALGGNGVETVYSGRIRDLSIGFQHFSRGLWDGFSLELDALVRNADTKLDEARWNSRIRTKESTTYAGRLMVGWSWLIQKRVFIALSVGFSSGIERGEEQIYRVDYDSEMSTHVATDTLDRENSALEGFLRFGIAFGRK